MLPPILQGQGGGSMSPAISTLVKRASDLTGVRTTELTGMGRDRRLCRYRFAVMKAARARGYSTPRIGKALGNRDHTTIMHGLDRAEQLAATDAKFVRLVCDILGERP